MLLATYLREQAEWREGKAVEYPEDLRNAGCAAALRSLADYIEREGAAHPAVLALDAMQSDYELDRFVPGEDGRRLISRFGFDQANPNFDAFLDDLAVAEMQYRIENGLGDQ